MDFFLNLHKNMLSDLLEAPYWGASNEYPQHMFLRKNNQTTFLDILLYLELFNSVWCLIIYMY